MNALAMIAIVLSGLTAVAAALLIPTLKTIFRAQRGRHDALELQLAAVRRELELVVSVSTRTGSQLQRMQRDHASVMDRVGVMEMRGESRPYDQAIDAARRGDNADQLTQCFGLSHGEAELVRVLHGSQRRSA